MKSNTDLSDRLQFNSVAEHYEKVRTSYPDKLFEDICAWVDFGEQAQILDIGCGTGQMSIAFAERGLGVVAVEPGNDLARIARQKLSKYTRVEVVEGFFEDWNTESRFDCIVSANAFHWIRPEVGYPKIHSLLRPGGAVALFWNFPTLLGVEASAITRALDREDSELRMFTDCAWTEPSMAAGAEEMGATGLFGEIQHHHYRWKQRLTADEYVLLLLTYANYARLPPERREEVSARLRFVINGQLGGSVTLSHSGFMRFARRLGGAS